MSDLEVRLQPPYPVRLRDTFAQAWDALRTDQADRRWFIVADRTLVERCPAALRTLSLAQRRGVVLLRGGEGVKSWRTMQQLADAALHAGVDRRTLLVAVGGGTVGDVAGFFAASYLRGIDWCPLATTSLAMADSAIGGKTAINGPGVKNLVGAFHQPRGVYGALEALDTLPPGHLRAGLAEVVKCAIVADAELFHWLEDNAESLLARDPRAWGHALGAANRIKAAVVSADPQEQGGRAVLNFGHTVGHALEATERPRLLHGEAISLGMIAASWVSEQRIRAEEGMSDRIRSLLARLGLPVRRAGRDSVGVMKAIGYDKKSQQGKARLVLTPRIGLATFGHEVEWSMLDRALRSLSGLPAPQPPAPEPPTSRPRRARGSTRGAGR